MARLLYGEYDEADQVGVLVFPDLLHSTNYRLADPELQRFSSQGQIEKVISTLANFHATCTAFEHSKGEGQSLDQIFPFLKAEADHGGYIWFHSDMQAYLQEMYDTCLQFLKVREKAKKKNAFHSISTIYFSPFPAKRKPPHGLNNA